MNRLSDASDDTIPGDPDDFPPPVIPSGEAQAMLSEILDAHVASYRRLEAFTCALARALDGSKP